MLCPFAVTFAARLTVAGAVKLPPLVGEERVMVGSGITVTRKFVVVQSEGSQTVTAMVDVPVWPAAGVTVMVQTLPLPLKAMFAAGTKEGFEELADTVRFAAGVCASPIMNASGPVLVFALMV